MPRQPMRFAGPVLGSTDPLGLARFYERLLGWPVTEIETAGPRDPSGDGWAKIRSPAEDVKMEFQFEPYHTPPVWPPVPGEQQMMIHLDIGVEDLDAGVAWALEAGATLAEH
ncbi:MAG: VOC family protein, partial [Dehalococcoidia bacterium]